MNDQPTPSNTAASEQLPKLTENAIRRARQLIEEEGRPLCLRVFVTGGGCAGFQYGFTFDELIDQDDTVAEKKGVTLLIDPMSFPYLEGAEIDYEEGLQGSRFLVNNPKASATCGCGSSFSI